MSRHCERNDSERESDAHNKPIKVTLKYLREGNRAEAQRVQVSWKGNQFLMASHHLVHGRNFVVKCKGTAWWETKIGIGSMQK